MEFKSAVKKLHAYHPYIKYKHNTILEVMLFFLFPNSPKPEKENNSSADELHMDEWTSARERGLHHYVNGETNHSLNKNDQHQQDSCLPQKTQLRFNRYEGRYQILCVEAEIENVINRPGNTNVNIIY